MPSRDDDHVFNKRLGLDFMLTLRRSLGLLLVVLFAMGFGYMYGNYYDVDWLKEVSLNLGTEIVGILLTVWLVDAVLRRNELLERTRIRRVIFTQLRRAIQSQLMILQSMYKAAAAHSPENLPQSVSQLFGPDYYVQIAFLDFSKPAPLASVDPLQWFDHLHHEAECFKSALAHTIEKYAVFLDAATVEILEELMASAFISIVMQLRTTRSLDVKAGLRRQCNFFGMPGGSELVKQYVDLFQKLVDISNKELPSNNKITLKSKYWGDGIAPQFGSARI